MIWIYVIALETIVIHLERITDLKVHVIAQIKIYIQLKDI